MALDLATDRHPQRLLATYFNGEPLTVEHGAPPGLLVPVKLGWKKSQETFGPNGDIRATPELEEIVELARPYVLIAFSLI